MLGEREQRHLPLNMKLWINESHIAYKEYYNLFITHGNILLHIILTLPFYVNSIFVPLSSEKDDVAIICNRYKGDMENLGKPLFLSKYKLLRTRPTYFYIFSFIFQKVQQDIMFRLKMAWRKKLT